MPTISSVNFETFRQETLVISKPPFRSLNTGIKMRHVLGLLEPLGVRQTADIDFALVSRFIRARLDKGACVNTVRGELSYLSSACSFAVEQGWLESNPCASKRLKLREEPAQTAKVHSLLEVSRVLERLRMLRTVNWTMHRLYAFAMTVAYTGLRRNEALYLKPEDLHLDAAILEVVPRRSLKTVGSAAPIPLPPPLVIALRDWLPSCGLDWVFPGNARRSPWVSGALGTKAVDQLKRAGESVGVEGLTIASLRHDYASHSESAWGLSELTLQRVLRHTNSRTQRRYRHAELRNLALSVAGVSYSASPSNTAP